MKIKNKKIKKNEEIKIALRHLAVFHNQINENRNFLFSELEDEKISAS